MDFNLKQWRDQQQESEEEQQQEQPCAKIPRQLLIDSPQNHQQQEPVPAALPLFVSAETQNNNKINTNLSAYSDNNSTPTAIPTNSARYPRMGGGHNFSIAQWQELELQALIFRHMMAGATVPPELLQLVKKSLLTSSASPFYLHHYAAHFQPAALLQAGYWGKGAMDPEPGRCRRTDGKKWRCSRDVVAGHKYCERHMHRGRNRSRKPVEFPASNNGGGAAGGIANTGSLVASGGTPFSLTGSGAASLDAFQLNQGSSELRSDKKALFDPQNEPHSEDGKNNSKVLMHFFDDWPRTDSNPESNGGSLSSSTSLSMSTPSNPTSDFLRLSTGNANGDELSRRRENEDRDRAQLGWTAAWGANPVSSMGGPLAEAFRSSTNSSPTSVLHQLPRSVSDTSYVSA